MEVRPVLRPFAILFVFLSIPSTVRLLSQNAENGLPAFSQGWTEPEKADFRYCVSHISDISRENTMQLSAVCVRDARRPGTLDASPSEGFWKERKQRQTRKVFEHPLRVKDTAQEFHASFDLCKRGAYGLPAPKQ